MAKTVHITPWAQHRVLAAQKARVDAEQNERRTIKEVFLAGDADKLAIANTLGVKNRQRIDAILNDDAIDTTPRQPEMPAVVFIIGAGVPQDDWDRIEDACHLRGWYVTKSRPQAWDLAHAGLDVVLCDFSAITRSRQPRDVVTVSMIKAQSRVQKNGHITFKQLGGGDHPRPLRDGQLDENILAHLIAIELVAE